MAKLLSDENWKITFLPTITSASSPTATELNAGLDIQCLVAMNNFSLGATGENTIDDPALCSGSNDQAPGKTTYEAQMEFYRFDQDEEDIAYTTFADKGIGGYLVRRIGKDHRDPYVAGDKVAVYQVITGTPRPLSPSGGYEKFMLAFYPQGSGTDERAVVV